MPNGWPHRSKLIWIGGFGRLLLCFYFVRFEQSIGNFWVRCLSPSTLCSHSFEISLALLSVLFWFLLYAMPTSWKAFGCCRGSPLLFHGRSPNSLQDFVWCFDTPRPTFPHCIKTFPKLCECSERFGSHFRQTAGAKRNQQARLSLLVPLGVDRPGRLERLGAPSRKIFWSCLFDFKATCVLFSTKNGNRTEPTVLGFCFQKVLVSFWRSRVKN